MVPLLLLTSLGCAPDAPRRSKETGTPPAAEALSTLATRTLAAMAEGFGAAVACGADATGNGLPDVLIGVPTLRQTSYTSKYGPAYGMPPTFLYVEPGNATDSWVLAQHLALASDPPPDALGRQVAWVPDQDGDGAPEVYTTVNAWEAGDAVLRFSDPLGVGLSSADAAGRIAIEGGDPAYALVALPDLGGDGAPDLAIGVAGAVLWLHGALVGDDPTGATATRITPAGAGPWFGAALAAGDLSGDGTVDLVVRDGDRLQVLDGAALGSGAAWAVDVPEGMSDPLVADVSGDGNPDLVAVAWGGWIRAWFGPLTGPPSGGPDAQILPPLAGEDMGTRAVAADIDGDGAIDLAVADLGCSAMAADWCASGDLAVIRVHRGPLVAGARAAEDAAWTWTSRERDDAAGQALAACDVDGDGDDELIVGAPDGSTGANGPHTGVVYWVGR